MAAEALSTADLRSRASRLGFFAFAWFLAIVGVGTLALVGPLDRLVDVHVYWSAWHDGLYSGDYQVWVRPSYCYSPAFAQLLWPLTHLPWEAFGALWLAGAWGAYAWLLWPLPRSLRVPLVVAFGIWTPDNIYWLYAMVAAAALRFPGALAFPILTKIAPGVGILWFAVRREWRWLGSALVTLAAIVAVSFAIAPSQWFAWKDLLLGVDNGVTGATPFVPLPPMTIRFPLAAIVVAWGARSGRAWTIPVSMLLAQPDINFPTLGVLAALPRMTDPIGANARSEPATPAPAVP